MARHRGRAGGRGSGSGDPGADGRDRPDHLDGDLRLRPAPLQGALDVHGGGRHPRARADGDRRGGRLGGEERQARRPRRPAVQHRVRALLHVRAEPPVAVRDHPGARAGEGRRPLRLHEALRTGRGRPGGISARAAGPVRADQGARGPCGRALPLPLGRDSHRLAGRQVRRHAEGRHPRRLRARPDRPVLGPRREAAGRRARPRASISSRSASSSRASPGPRRSSGRATAIPPPRSWT